jgi:predicted component of type VI protein secretion system
MPRLIAHLPDESAREFRLDQGRMTIGRRADNDVCLPFPAVSAEHAAVVTIGADSFLEDLDSTNGTLVNGERITKHFLRDGDRIDVGRLELVYLAGDDANATLQQVQELRPAEDAVEQEAGPPPAADGSAAAERGADAGVDADRDADASTDRDAVLADEFLDELMETQSAATAAVDIPPTLSIVPPLAASRDSAPAVNGAKLARAEALVTILSGPNAGKTTPMTRAQFVFGRPGVTVAAIRRSGVSYRLVPLGGEALPTVNGDTIAREGIELAFGDTIDVAGVKLRFERRV